MFAPCCAQPRGWLPILRTYNKGREPRVSTNHCDGPKDCGSTDSTKSFNRNKTLGVSRSVETSRPNEQHAGEGVAGWDVLDGSQDSCAKLWASRHSGLHNRVRGSNGREEQNRRLLLVEYRKVAPWV